MTNLDSVLKSRDIILPTKVHIGKAMVFPLVTYGCESWTTKKAEHQRINAFKQWCWRGLFWVRQTARRSNQSILKEISPEYPMERLLLKLKSNTLAAWWEELDLLEKTLMLGKIEGKRRRGWQRMKWLDGIVDSMDMSLSKLQDIVNAREAWSAAVYEATKCWTRPSNWTTTKSPQQTTNIFMWIIVTAFSLVSVPPTLFLSHLSAHERRVICIEGQSRLCPWMQTFRYVHMLGD